MKVTELLAIALGAILTNNFIFSQFLGICPFMGVSKKIDTAVGMGAAVTFVMGLASALCYPVNKLLDNLGLGFMQTVAFILVIAGLVQFVEMFLKKNIPTLYAALGVYLPLITTNCAVLGVALLNTQNSYNFVASVIYGITGGLGFLLAIFLFAAVREQLDVSSECPKAFEGFPIALVTAGLMALFADVDRISKVGPVGPGRDLFLQAALPLNAMPVSIDKNVYAANLLNTLAYQDLDGYHVGKTAFAFDQGRQDAGYREENCWYTTGELIRNGAASYGTALEGSNTPLFRFGTREEVAPENRSGMSLTVTFSKSDSEQLNYNTGTGLYEKLNADGSPMTDADNGQQAAFTNVFVLYASSGIKDDATPASTT